MANRKPQNNRVSRATRIMQITFAIFSILLILSMILSAFITPQ